MLAQQSGTPAPSESEQARSAIQKARAFGIDVSLFRSALDRTPAERLLQLDENARALPLLQLRHRPLRKKAGTSLLSLISGLREAGVRFVAIGGVAAVAHGSARLTFDLDVCYDPSPSNIEALAQMLVRWNALPWQVVPALREIPDAQALAACTPLRLQTSDGDLDLFASVEGVGDYEVCESELEWIEVPPLRFPVLGLDALIRSKRTLRREEEREVLLELELLRALINLESRGRIIRS